MKSSLTPTNAALTNESGIALLLTILMLLLVSAVGVSALNRAGDENTVATASRRQVTNMAAAEGALKMAEAQLLAAQAGTPTPTTSINFPNFIQENNGRATSVRSGTVGNSAAVPIEPIGTRPVQGGDARYGKAMVRLIYRVSVVATGPRGGNVQLEAQYAVRR